MVGKMSKLVLCSFVLVLACTTVFAQSGLKVAHTATPSKEITPAPAIPAGTQTIFSNLGPSASNDYNDTSGYYVLGPTNSIGDGEQWIAIPFTPTADSTVTTLQGAIGWISGTRRVILALYSDNAGVPGTILAKGTATHISNFGACCGLVSVTVTSTAVTAGTQYWVGARTDDTRGPDFTGVFQSSNLGTTAYNPALAGWTSFTNNWPAAAVLGTTP